MRATLRRVTRATTPLAVAGLILTACGTEDPEVADAPDEAEDAETTGDAGDTADTEDQQADPPADATVQVGATDLGDVLVDGDGRTLYLFEPDEQRESTCYDDCAANWPPLLDDDPAAGDGADAGLLGTSEREDGHLQVTYDGWPLYHWIGDEQPGDVAGQGVQDVWWAVAADGQPLRDAAGADEPEEDEAPRY